MTNAILNILPFLSAAVSLFVLWVFFSSVKSLGLKSEILKKAISTQILEDENDYFSDIDFDEENITKEPMVLNLSSKIISTAPR